jgi:ABC-2 type transport system permease protein
MRSRPLVRISAFVRNELVGTLRQPRLLVTLVLGPFLVLFLFGIGYVHELPSLSTLVVSGEGALADEVDAYLRETEPATIDYRGTSDDRDAAFSQLRDGEVDLVVVLPDRALERIADNERAVVEVHQRSLDPLTENQIWVAAGFAVAEINDRVLAGVFEDLQARTGGFTDELAEASQQLDRIRSAVDREDARALQALAGTTAERFEDLADVLGRGGFVAGSLGLGDRVDEYEQALRTGAELLRSLSQEDGLQRLDEAATTLEEVEVAVDELQAIDPLVAVEPFEAEVISDTPAPVTLDRYYAPGVVALMLQHLAVTFAALSLVRERSRGTTALLHASPATLTDRLVGKGAAFLLIGLGLAAALTALIMLVFGVPGPVSWLALAGVVLLVLAASVAYGYLVAAIASTDSQAVQFSMLLFLTAIFFTGLFMPLERISMPTEIVSWLMPATYGTQAMQQLMLLQQPVQPVLLGGLAVMTVVLFAVARWLLGRQRPV